MALMTCWECGGTVSDTADACPHCGAKLKGPAKKTEPVGYDIRTECINTWGAGTDLQDKLQVFVDQGWEIVSTAHNPWLSGLLRPVYNVTMRRPKYKDPQVSKESKAVVGVTGKKLTHRTYGAGTITERDGDILTVRFADRSMRLSYLYSSRKGLLQLSDPALKKAFDEELQEKKSVEKKKYGVSLIGEEARHKSFGEGIITGRDGDVLTVYFGSKGEKNLSCDYNFKNRLLQLDDRVLQEQMTKRQGKK